MEYAIKLDRFEGPYTKLLSLIEERKLSITEIDLAHLADDYINYTKTLEKKDHLDISLFIVIASTLMLIKVKSLLPQADYTTQEENQIDDLTKKLLLLDHLEKATKSLHTLFKHKHFFSLNALRIKKKEFSFPKNVTLQNIVDSADLLLREKARKDYIQELSVAKKIQLSDVTSLLRSQTKMVTTLHEVSLLIPDDSRLVLSFLSLLELIRTGEYHAYQKDSENIVIEKRDIMLQ
jgi:segregation and condensation protein A